MAKSPYDRGALDIGLGRVVSEGMMTSYMRPPPPPTPLQLAEQEIARLVGIANERGAELERLKKPGSVTGIVALIRENSVVVAVGPQFAEVARPPGMNLYEGCAVRLAQPQLQVLDVVETVAVGSVHEVSRVLPGGLVEVACLPVPRAVLCPAKHKVREGDRVVIDGGQIVVLRNLGPARGDRFALTADPGVLWEDVIGQEEAVRAMREAVEEPVLMADLYAELGKRPSKGVLLSGPPGGGKSLLGKAVATWVLSHFGGEYRKTSMAYIKGPELMNKYVGQSEENVRMLFEGARRHKAESGYPQVVFIDEAESLLFSRAKKEGKSSVDVNVVQAFLAELDGLEDSAAFFLLATNRPQDIDPAVLRDGRIDTKVRMKRPSREDTALIALAHLSKAKCESGAEETSAKLAESLHAETRVLGMATDAAKAKHRVTLGQGMSGALVVGAVEAAKQVAIRRARKNDGPRAITVADVEEAARAKYAEQLGLDHHEVACEVVGGPEKLLRFEPARG